MTDQYQSQQNFAQQGQGFFTDDQGNQWVRQTPVEGDQGQMQGGQAGADGMMNHRMDTVFADAPQVPAIAQNNFNPPANTTGPYWDPETKWHVKSTLPAGQLLPIPMEDGYLGPYYSPSAGWHYKMMFAPGEEPMDLGPFLNVQEGYTPATGTPISSAMPSGVATPVYGAPAMPMPYSDPAARARLAPPTSRRKPKYGPAAYLEKNSRNSISAHPRAVSVTEANYTSAAKRRDYQSGDEAPARVGRKRKNQSIVQTCVCSGRSEKKIKRPRNAFILYRSSRKEQIMKAAGTQDNQVVSRQAGIMWRDESDAVKAQFHQLAAQEKIRHSQENPGYRYQPGLADRQKFGSASCRCGAYEANMKAMGRQRASAFDIDEEDYEEEDGGGDGDDAYIPPKSFRTVAPPAPYAMPQAPQAPLPDATTFGFYIPAQQAQAQAAVAEMSRKRSAAAAAIGEYSSGVDDVQLAKRLRSANANVNLTAETQAQSAFEFDFGEPGQPYNYQQLAVGVDPDSPPARNTRAQSKARASPPNTANPLVGQDQNQPQPQDQEVSMLPDPIPDWDDDLFGEGVGDDLGYNFGADVHMDVDEDIGENITVANRRPSQEGQNHSYSLRPRAGSQSPPK